MPDSEQERAEYDKRARELTELAEELGLYEPVTTLDGTELELYDEPPLPLVTKPCPFCGAALPCPAHRPGG